jgi:hypothetical protein
MACCAIAIFLLSQAYVVIAALRELIFGKTNAAQQTFSGAASWRWDEAPEAPAVARGPATQKVARLLRLSPAKAVGAFAIGALSVAVLTTVSHSPSLVLGAQAICGRLLP